MDGERAHLSFAVIADVAGEVMTGSIIATRVVMQ